MDEGPCSQLMLCSLSLYLSRSQSWRNSFSGDSVADPDSVSGVFFNPGSGSGMEKNLNPGTKSRVIFLRN
jgi:hypothetical protein